MGFDLGYALLIFLDFVLLGNELLKFIAATTTLDSTAIVLLDLGIGELGNNSIFELELQGIEHIII